MARELQTVQTEAQFREEFAECVARGRAAGFETTTFEDWLDAYRDALRDEVAQAEADDADFLAAQEPFRGAEPWSRFGEGYDPEAQDDLQRHEEEFPEGYF